MGVYQFFNIWAQTVNSILFKNPYLSILSVITLWIFSCSNVLAAAAVSDIRNTTHNLAMNSGNTVRATTNNEVCVFCHTPHGATQESGSPLWNRSLTPGTTYEMYGSLSIDATDVASAPGGASKLCLSCHDGTIALGTVNIANGQVNPMLSFENAAPDGSMPSGAGESTGFTRRLGTNLKNDHPISFTYDQLQSTSDGELRDPSNPANNIGNRVPGNHPQIPLEDNRVQCTSCHDPHIRDADLAVNRKFLRLNRLQQVSPTGGSFDVDNDIMCLACHDKGGQAWAISAHADPADANESYTSAATTQYDFPAGTSVWQASCLNCHDAHSVEGARRLLREGTDSLSVPKAGGSSAIEQTCYQCHQNFASSSLNIASNTDVPNIKSDFALSKHMPIQNSEQSAGTEIHDISDADFSETATNIGQLSATNRHVECTDCHNPHRVTHSQKFNSILAGDKIDGTHLHDNGSNVHDNLASGALRGSIGVEPFYSNIAFQPNPVLANSDITYTVKKGIPPLNGSTLVSASYVTREYQVCLRCHSNYGFGSTPPTVGTSGGATAFGTNGVVQYTNLAMEFQAPSTHKGEPNNATGTGAATDYDNTSNYNHRSWHPVIEETGRTTAVRGGIPSGNWRVPFSRGVGTQTMYCSDCHGSGTGNTTVEPTGDNPWGPHGSTNNFILKGDWTPSSVTTSSLCFRCHSTQYRDGGLSDSGFYSNDKGELHDVHNDRIGKALQCNWCHVAVPHGWKNKALLVNLNDVGPEVGFAAGTEVCTGSSGFGETNCDGNSNDGYSNGPYYQNSYNKIITFRQSGTWRDSDCGSDSGTTGRDWMRDTACDNPQ